MKTNQLTLTILILLMVACTSTIEPIEPVDTAVSDKTTELAGKEESAPPVPTTLPIKESKEAKMTTLDGTSWHLPILNGQQSNIAPFKDQITLEFAEGSISGSAGCNRYFASYKQADDGTLTFSSIGSTRRACQKPLMNAESQFLQALEQTTAFTISEDGTQLTLKGGGIEIAFRDRDG